VPLRPTTSSTNYINNYICGERARAREGGREEERESARAREREREEWGRVFGSSRAKRYDQFYLGS
jgi:hypothetical protein